MDIAGAYATLAKECMLRGHVGGEKNRRYVSSVTVDGSALETLSEEGGRACDQFTAWEIDASLADVVEGNNYSGTTNTVFPVRGKTGTAPYNIVFVGYQPEIEKLVVVSFASDNPTVTGKLPKRVTGGGYAAPAAMDILDHLALER
jgi:membrane peptidoglycan carboxypeptidase